MSAGQAGPLARHWRLQPDLDFLNHGSFGACPKPVLAAQLALREEMEAQPVAFLARRVPGLIDAARERVAAFVGAEPDDLVPMPNATTGVNTVLRALDLAPGDEILVTDHAYNACRNAIDVVATRRGARAVVVRLPLPTAGPGDVVEAVIAQATPRTRLALIDHVTSPTALVFPVAEIVAQLAARGVDTLIDGAHAPGMVPLAIPDLGAAYYTGNCHKWLCAPKGAALLWVRRDRQAAIHPLAMGHGHNTRRSGRSRFHDEFDWVATDDPTAFLCVPAAIDFMATLLPGGWPEIMRRNHDLAVAGRRTLIAELGLTPPCPEAMLGSMAALAIPDGPAGPRPEAGDPLQARLLARHAIEIPVPAWPAWPQRLVRLSAQVYNDAAQYGRLARALGHELAQK